MSKVKRALKRAAAYSAGGSIGPAPKAHKLVGEFRDPTERAGGIPFLIPYGTNPKNIDRALGARRHRDPNETYPERGRATVQRAADGGVIDDLAMSLDMRAAHQPTPEERAANLKTTGMDALSATPVIGNLLSAKDAGTSGREAYEAARSGNLKRALGQAALTGLNAVGAVTGLPFGKAAGDAAKGGSSRLNTFVGPEARTADKTALAKAEEMRTAGADRDTIWRETGWSWDERGLPFFEISDKNAKLRPRGITQPQFFDDFIQHPELFEARPDIAGKRFSESSPAGGGYHSKPDLLNPDGRIDVGEGSPTKRLSIALHEGQHAADFGRGANHGANVKHADPDALLEAADAMTAKYGTAFTRWMEAERRYQELFRSSEPLDSPVLADAARAVAAADQELAKVQRTRGGPVKPSGYAYEHNPGEVRARNVEARRTMDDAERREAPPWHTADVDEADILSGRGQADAPSQVMIPAPESKANDLARDLRSQGISNESVERNTGRFFGMDGSLRTEVDDRGMTLKRGFEPGDRAPMSDVIDHPALFGQRPELRDRPVNFTDVTTTEANQPGKRFGVARRAPDGSHEITAGQSLDFYKAQLGKLLQYDVAKDNNWGAGIRHDFQGVRDDYANALRVALDIASNPKPGEDVGAALAYIERLQPFVERMMKATGPETNKLYKEAQKLTSGNIDARVVRQRAVQTDAARAAAGRYPYRQGVRGVGPGFVKAQVIPFADAPREDVAKMLGEMDEFGIGRGNFANGGRAKRVNRALRRARLTVGAVKGATGGRADALQVSVPAGSYVVPADVVAALGEGNTAAGMAALERKFPAGKSAAPRRANGGAVPIHISDGEFVIPPAAIAKLGPDGHGILDRFVLSTRKAYTDHLANLPGPNQ